MSIVCVLATACAVDEDEAADLVTEDYAAGAVPTWAGPVGLSPGQYDAQTRYNFGKQLAIDPGGGIHVTWVAVQGDDSLPQVTGDIYYQRSIDGGLSWSTPTRLSRATATVSFPKIAVSGPYVYVVWHEISAGIATSYLARSTDRGMMFSAPSAVSAEHGPMPAVAASGYGVHVVWGGYDAAHGANEIYVRSSIDLGATWRTTRMVSSADGRTSWTPVIAAEGTTLYVAWTDERHNRNPDGTRYDCGQQDPPPWADDDGCREEIYFRKSTDLGATWSAEQRLTTSVQGVGHNAASLVVAAGTAHVTYFRKPAAQYAILYQRSTTGGASFAPQVVIDSGRLVMRPSVAARGDRVGIAYTAVIPNVGARIFYASSLDRGATFGAPTAVVVGNGESMQPSLELDPANASHVVFTDRATPGAATHRVFFARTLP